jgi:hypothetical protein
LPRQLRIGETDSKKKLGKKNPFLKNPLPLRELLETTGNFGVLMKFERRIDTRQASDFLTERGYKIAPATLNKKRCVGGGPEFELFGRRPLYTERALLEWVQSHTTDSLRSTSNLTARRRQRKPATAFAPQVGRDR